MNGRLFPMSRRCRYCGVPLLRGRVCAEHRPLEAADPMFALETILNSTGSASAIEAQGRALEVKA